MDPDLMTPTQKVRRDRLEVKFAHQIQGMYADEIVAPDASEIQTTYAVEKTNG
jgi:hypothetical protein